MDVDLVLHAVRLRRVKRSLHLGGFRACPPFAWELGGGDQSRAMAPCRLSLSLVRSQRYERECGLGQGW